ncbi:MAG: protein phosphatase 2C domain-containing protein [Sphingomonas fennica]
MIGLAAAAAPPLVGAGTHVGKVRHENEDALVVAPAGGLWGVADGMGGHARGAWASRTVCQGLEALRPSGRIAHDIETIADALADANDLIVAEGARGGSTIGTTVVALVTGEGRYACLWAGDSRIYLIRDGAIRQLTRDHSQVEELVTAGVLSREAARDHPLGNVVTRAVGVAPGLAIDCVEDALRPGDRFLLCSDGLTKVMEDEEIARTLAPLPPAAGCDALIATVLDRGAPDNVTVIVVDVPA